METTYNFVPEKEFLLAKNNARFSLFPIVHKDIWDLKKKMEGSLWHAHEIHYRNDLYDWENKLTDNERFFIKNILAFFANSDGIVNENLVVNFYNEVQIPEARSAYAEQIKIEDVHAETYALYIDTYIKDTKEKEKLFNSIDSNPIVSKKASWALKWLNRETPFPQRLMAFGIVEGIFFSASFCSIFWLKQKKIMNELVTGNEFISRDESSHCELCVLLYHKISQKLPEKLVHQMFAEAIQIETEFVTESLPVNLLGMNKESMIEYIKYIADFWIVKFGYSKLYNTKNPFPWMDTIALSKKGNFFEVTDTNYSIDVNDIDINELDLDKDI